MKTDTRRTIVLMFSGLGSEIFQMGRDLFAKNQVFQASMLELDHLARRLAGQSIVSHLYRENWENEQPFRDLADECLAVYMLQIAMARTLRVFGIEPDCTLAVSMGFFAAATVGRCMEPQEAMQAIIHQARALEVRCPPGGMMAVLGPVEISRDPSVSRFCEVAAINGPSHFVVSADPKGLDSVEEYLRQSRIVCQRLPIRYAFHSHWIDEARAPLENLFAGLAGRRFQVPTICCARADRILDLSADYFWKVAREPIRFYESILSFDQGANLYIDAGPAGSLAAVLKSALPPASRSLVMSTLTPFHNELQNLEALLPLKTGLFQGIAPLSRTNRITA